MNAEESMDYLHTIQMRQSEQTFQMRELEEQRVSETSHKDIMHNVTNPCQIDAALDNDDVPVMERLLVTALSDPQLPVLLRAKYEILLAMCPSQDPVLHVRNAERMFVRIQHHIDEGDASEHSIGVFESLKSLRDLLLSQIVYD